jgi:hypothetical protein
MKAPNNNLTIYRGTAPILRFTVDPDSIQDADPASGWTTSYVLRATAASPDPLDLQVSGAWNATDSTIDVAITRAQTLALAKGRYTGALFRTDTGAEDELSQDTVTVLEGIYDAP